MEPLFANLTRDDFDRLQDVSLDTDGIDADTLERIGTALAVMQRGINWWIGDAARAAQDRLKMGDNVSQIWPEWMSLGLVQRSEAVARAYEPKERQIDLTWTQHMTVANKPDRVQQLEAAAGKTSDETRERVKQAPASGGPRRWLLAIDCNYFLHSFYHSGADIEAAATVAAWIARTVDRLKQKGLTDVACCFDSKVNHRKELTKEWEHKYKDRPKKDDKIPQQLTVLVDLLEQANFCCCSLDGMEADDLMASYAASFNGVVSLLTQDKDMRQCLNGDSCNILYDVEWKIDEHTGDNIPAYDWIDAKRHTKETGLTPAEWIEYQCIAGDNVDGIKGAIGIGVAVAPELVKKYGTVEATIAAAKEGIIEIPDKNGKIGPLSPKKLQALIDLEAKLEVTRALVTLRTDLPVPNNTRI